MMREQGSRRLYAGKELITIWSSPLVSLVWGAEVAFHTLLHPQQFDIQSSAFGGLSAHHAWFVCQRTEQSWSQFLQVTIPRVTWQ
jgi:hypothetical protein